MATELKLRRGTTSQHSTFTGAEAEVTVDTDKETVVVHDGTTVGGYALAREDMSNVPNDTISGDQIAGGDATFDSINVDSGTLFVDSTNNRVGIGTSSPSEDLTIMSSTPKIRFEDAESLSHNIIDGSGAAGALTLSADVTNQQSSSRIAFEVDGSEAARIDSSGNLLVGTSSDNPNDPGARMFASGTVNACRDNARSVIFGRNTSDGDILEFRKDGQKKGEIGTAGAAIYIAGINRSGITFAGDDVRPTDDTGSAADDVYDLGNSNARWKDLYLSGGVYLGGTGSANKLDDYEEGTWTPALVNAELGDFSDAFYTKIGRQVFLTAQLFAISSFVNASDLYSITNLPFSVASFGYGAIEGERFPKEYHAIRATDINVLRIRHQDVNGFNTLTYGEITSTGDCNMHFSVSYITND